jgi:cell division protein FtsI/penicillin-binding protein 2
MAKKKAAKAKPVSKTVHHAKPKKNYTTLLIVVVAILAVIFFSLLYLRSAQKSEASSRGHEKSEGKEKIRMGS